ncbi:RNA polymerase sigma factor [Paenibacillus mesophilus]|uniref:RNA polymerase sigma factor n=1 Tax=Paenibacillus mesophilus TaxID=2582849 RepID=UPI00110D85E0|nr:RNA polymerase sigma factor [Paenibacillus mesophilus]TMV51610.1 RNA polymerase sigma factor [Paenibacillus mesophilus]
MVDHEAGLYRDLVEKARKGDAESFGELVRRHRSQMLGWADRVVRNRTKAEDIVQDALMQSLKKIGSLEHPDKFIPWLRTLVHNQALMSIRGVRNKREVAVGDGWSELESGNAQELRMHADDDANDPQRSAIGRAAIEDVRLMLERLSEREKAVVDAHLIAGLPVQEVARMLDMTSGAVYTTVSRSRKKLTEARYEAEVERYVSARRKAGKPSASRTDWARHYRFAGAYNTMVSMMRLTIAAGGNRDCSLSDVMGATGHAFRIKVASDIGVSGPYAYDWTTALRDGFRHLGYSVSVFGGAGMQLERPDELIAAMDELFVSLEKAVPVVAWNVSNAEFGIITGFDDDKRAWTVTDTSAADKLLPYSKLGRLHEDTEWFAAVPGRRIVADRAESLCGLFMNTARHIRGGGEDGGSRKSDLYGIGGSEAYRTWIRLLDRQSLSDPLGAAYNAAVVHEARKHAASYLRGLSVDGYMSSLCPSAVPAITHAQQQYARVAAAWEAVAKLFPLPYGADPTAPGPADRAARLLERALGIELEAASALEEAASLLASKPVQKK